MEHSDMLRARLCGSLIGLARTCSNNPPTQNTMGLLLAGLHLSAPDSGASPDQLQGLLDRVQADKALVSPNCVTCTARCGKNDDYDISRLDQAEDDVRAAKIEILSGLREMARRGLADPLIFDALFALAEDWDAETLRWYARKTHEIAQNHA